MDAVDRQVRGQVFHLLGQPQPGPLPAILQEECVFRQHGISRRKTLERRRVDVAERQVDIRGDPLLVRLVRGQHTFELLKPLIGGVGRGVATDKRTQIGSCRSDRLVPREKLAPRAARRGTGSHRRQPVRIVRQARQLCAEFRQHAVERGRLRMRKERIEFPRLCESLLSLFRFRRRSHHASLFSLVVRSS